MHLHPVRGVAGGANGLLVSSGVAARADPCCSHWLANGSAPRHQPCSLRRDQVKLTKGRDLPTPIKLFATC
jgi:hypothetical protein